MLVYLVDELLHFCCGEAIQHGHSHGLSEEEQQLIIPEIRNQQSGHSHRSSYGTTTPSITSQDSKKESTQETCEEHQHQHDIEDDRINERICHTSHAEPCNQTLAGVIGMLTALSIHSFIEGLAIGIQTDTAAVMILFIAVMSHKFVVGFCLGVELSVSPGATFKRHFIAIFVFSAGSVLGIAIGMALVDLAAVQDSNAIGILQGVAGGTLLYVTVCEVLPREKARWHQSQSNRSAGLIQFLAFAIGFTVMTIINVYVSEGD